MLKLKFLFMFSCLSISLHSQDLVDYSTYTIKDAPKSSEILQHYHKKHVIAASTEKPESCTFGDFNGDGVNDIAAGSFLFMGPDFTSMKKFRTVRLYAEGGMMTPDDFTLARDVTGDGHVDIISGGHDYGLFVYENPGAENHKGLWKRHTVDAERPNGKQDVDSKKHDVTWHFARWVDLDGDGNANELLSSGCHCRKPIPSIKWVKFENGKWSIHKIGHSAGMWGAGVGDINGDGRADIIATEAWFEAPEDRVNGEWKKHSFINDVCHRPDCLEGTFTGKNGQKCGHATNIHCYDINKDGLNDFLLTSGHGSGFMWYQQVRDENGIISFKEHIVDQSIFTPHNLIFKDMNDDGIPDAVVGKRWDGWGHNDRAPNYLYYYQLTPGAQNPWKRHVVSYNEKIGMGTGGQVLDFDFDGDLDILGTTRENGIYVVENTTNTPSQDPWINMLTDNSLNGWKAFGNKADTLWSVKDQEIHSSASHLNNMGANWLQFDTELEDFELEFEVFTANTDGNSGVQVRSRYINNRIQGPQIDIEPSKPWRCGLVYDETGGCWIQPKTNKWAINRKEAPAHYQWYQKGWNRVRIRCEGTTISTWVNGIYMVTYDDAKHGYLSQKKHEQLDVGKKGYILLQQHAKSKLDMRFRKLRYRELKKNKPPGHDLKAGFSKAS